MLNMQKLNHCPSLNKKENCIQNEICGWNDKTMKCRKKSVRKTKEPTQLKHPKLKEIKCAHIPNEKECIQNEICGWNDKTMKCRKRSVRKTKEPTQLKQSKPAETKLGIHIGDKIINRISGPISLYFLKPAENVSALNLNFFPSVMLFGDQHWSKTNTCEKCSCSKKACCFKITDSSFLQLIDEFASKYPIDFYTETAFLGSKGFKGGFMEYFTKGDFVSCYHKSLRNTHFDKCPTKHIRWHASDSRYMDIQVHLNNRDSFPDNKNKKLLKENKLKISKKYINTSYIEPQIAYIILLISSIIQTTLDANSFYKRYYISKLFIYLPFTIFKTLENFIHFLQNAVYKNKLDINRLTKNIFSMMNINNSMFYKQIAKQTFEPFKHVSYWVNLFNTVLEQNESVQKKLSEINSLDLMFSTITNVIYEKNDYMDSQINREILKKTNDFLELLYDYRNLLFLDLYMITRMLKQPDGGQRSYMSFGYFGNAHVLNIKNLLVHTGFYVVDKQVEFDPQHLRCIEIDFSLDLDAEMKRREHFG
jgi:hypothetical protein